MKIQAVHRGKAARKEVEERKEQEAAAVKIQAVHRGKAARKEVEERKEQEAAAVKIQAVHRGKAARKEVEERKEQEAAAVKIQAVHRGKAARKEVEERKEQEAAAVKIQAVHRGKAARKEVEERKEQEAAAVKIQAVHRGKAARKEVEERKEQEAAAVKIQAVHRGKAARKEVEERKEQEAAAVKIQAVHRGKAARKDLSARHPLKPSSPSTVHRSSSSTRPTPTTRKPSESLVTSSPSRASAPSTSESRVSASCKKLGIDPAAAAAQLAAFPAPQIEIPLRSGVPPPDTPALACLLLLENRQMSFRVRSEFELRDLRLATEFAEASAALKLPAGAAALVTFKRKGEALVRAVRRRAIRDGLLRPTARDEKRLEAMRAESSAAKRRDADLRAKRDAENAAAARASGARAAEKEKEATEAREKEARRRRRSMASVGVEGDFLERLSRDMRRRETELRATLARRRDAPISVSTTPRASAKRRIDAISGR